MVNTIKVLLKLRMEFLTCRRKSLVLTAGQTTMCGKLLPFYVSLYIKSLTYSTKKRGKTPLSLLTKLKNIQRRYFASSLQCSKATKLKLDLRLRQGTGHNRHPCLKVPASAIHGFSPASTLGLAKFCYRLVTSRSLCKISPLRKFVYSLRGKTPLFLDLFSFLLVVQVVQCRCQEHLFFRLR